VRAAIPWPVAHCKFGDAVCRIHKTDIVDPTSDEIPGAVTAVEKDRVLVSTGHGQLAVLAFQMPGKRVMAMGEFLRGRPIKPGERFENL
jgi:methionyl-tRNA formyltransferase